MHTYWFIQVNTLLTPGIRTCGCFAPILSELHPAGTESENMTLIQSKSGKATQTCQRVAASKHNDTTRERKHSQSMHAQTFRIISKASSDLEVYWQQTFLLTLPVQCSQIHIGLDQKEQEHPGGKGQPRGDDSYVFVIIHQHVEAE